MRLHEKYRPKRLDDVAGQPVLPLKHLVANPSPGCVLLEGATGVGKTTAAFALAHELGCYSDPWFETVYPVCGADFSADMVRHYFGAETPFRFRTSGWHLLVIEELEMLSPQCQRLCKDAFERVLGRYRAMVVATSNNATKLEKALRDRFRTYIFSAGRGFMLACQERLAEIWAQEAGPEVDMPHGWQQWGFDGEEFSMRRALDLTEEHLALLKAQKAILQGAAA